MIFKIQVETLKDEYYREQVTLEISLLSFIVQNLEILHSG